MNQCDYLTTAEMFKKVVTTRSYYLEYLNQQEKEEKFAKLRKQHERELRMLAKRSQKKVENIFRGVGGAGQDRLDTDEILKYEYASAPTKVYSSHVFLHFPFI